MNAMNELWSRLGVRYRRTMSMKFFKQPFQIETDVPLISFTFDDFPRSALSVGGAILNDFSAAGTYYASFGLMGKKDTPTGTIFEPEDLYQLLERGHELGCHTFHHHDAWLTKPSSFEESVVQNGIALRRLLPDTSFRTLSYPLRGPRPGTKRRVARHFVCCRGGGQTFNHGVTDLGFLRAYFLDEKNADLQHVKNVIDANRRARGWLIFATHDICNTPTRYGCTPDFFRAVVQHSVNSGARVLPVIGAWEALRSSNS
jgi:peptidoglycan/xylan/chitin deacetylase (PgdA/CDA1 family)